MFESTLSNPNHPDLQLDHYTVLGAGKSGVAAVMLLRALNLQVTLLDNDPDHVDEEARRMMDSKGSAIFDSAARLPEETQALRCWRGGLLVGRILVGVFAKDHDSYTHLRQREPRRLIR